MSEIETVSPLLATMIAAARLGGDIARQHFAACGQTKVDEKAARDYVTAADVAVETAIAAALAEAYPDWSINGEEKAGDRDHGPDAPSFLIDPIDGTTNFAWGIPFFGVVICACLRGNRIDAGVVYDPMRDELFSMPNAAVAPFSTARRSRSVRGATSTTRWSAPACRSPAKCGRCRSPAIAKC